MSITLYVIICIVIMAGVTVLLRSLPFIIFGKGKETPKWINYLGRVLPYGIIGVLVVYCLKGTSILEYPYGAPEGIACLVVTVLHIWKQNTLISISAGTICYMMLIQLVF